MLSKFFSCLLLLPITVLGQASLELAQKFYTDHELDSALHWVKDFEKTTITKESRKLTGDILFDLSRHEEAIEAYYEAIQESQNQDIPDPVFLAECYLYISECHGVLGHYQQALNVARTSLSYATDYSDPSMIADSKFNMSVFFVRLGQYDSALTYMQEVFAMDLEKGDSGALAYDYNSLGFIMGQKEEYEKAIEYYEKSIDYLNSGQQRELALRLSNIAMAELNLGRYARSEDHFRESMALYRELNNELKLNNQKVNLATLFHKTRQFDKASTLLNEALIYYVEKNNPYSECRTRIQMAKLFTDLNQQNSAMSELQRAQIISKNEGLLEEQIEILRMLSSLQFERNQFRLAYQNQEKLMMLKDSLDKNQQLNRIRDLELSMITEQKEQEIERLVLEKKLVEKEASERQLQQYGMGAIILILLLGGGTIIYLQRKRSKLERELLSKEVDDLRLQINAFINGKPDEFQLTPDGINEKLEQPLSTREFEILELALSDKSNREIAGTLFVSVNTVKFHLKKVYEKLGVSGRKEALQFIIKPKSN